MLVHQLLFSVIFYNDSKIIKAADQPPDLETVHKIDHYGQAFLTHVVQKAVLQVHHIFIARYIRHAGSLLIFRFTLNFTSF